MPTSLFSFPAANFADNSLPILCNDTAGICTIGTDFIFDALNPACYLAGALPATSAAVPTGGMLNLAVDAQPAINAVIARTGAVTASQYTSAGYGSTGSTPPTFDGKGWVTGGSSNYPFSVHKGGVADTRVGELVLEGFHSFAICMWIRLASTAANQTLLAAGAPWTGDPNQNFGSLAVNTGGSFAASLGSPSAVIGTPTAAQLTQIGGIFTFASGASTITPVFNGVLGTPVTGPSTPGSFASSDGYAAYILGVPGLSTPQVTLYRAWRTYFGISGESMATTFARDYAYGAARFA